MTYFSDLHAYLHQSSLLIQAYPSTRVTTKYSLPRKPKAKQADAQTDTQAESNTKREPAATLTFKTFHPESGICLKYQTDKAAEVGRLFTGLGKLAKGEIYEIPKEDDHAGAGVDIGGGQTLNGNDKMELDGNPAETKSAAQMTQQQQGGKKKKKSKK